MPARPSSAERARRLLALLALLHETEDAELGKLAAATGTDVATVAEDLALLSMCGADQTDPASLVPVLVEGDRALVFGQIPAIDSPVRLTQRESAALLAALEACGANPDDGLVRSLSAVTPEALDVQALASRVRVAGSEGGDVHTQALLTAAAADRRVTRISYVSTGSATPEDRTIHPWDLLMWRGHWYLRAWDEDRASERTFRLDRTSDVRVTGERFDRPAGLEPLTSAAPETGDLPRAQVVFSHDAPDLSEREWPGAVFEPCEDGTVRASIPFAGTAWIARRVAARLGDAVVISPPEVRSAVADLARRALADA